jgi:predicted cupin superfamily sugar epimerase
VSLPATGREIIDLLQMQAHPEGGWYREMHRTEGNGARSPGTAIYYLLQAGERSHWHRVDATEVWHWYAGAPLALSVSDGAVTREHRLGMDLAAGERPQAVVEPFEWQAAATLGEWTLCGCTVSPGFEFAGFELAAPDWRPGDR